MSAVPNMERLCRRVEATGELGRFPRERPSPGPEAARIEEVFTGEVVAKTVTVGTGGDPASTVAGALGCAVLLVPFREKVDVDTILYLGKASGCARDERNSRGGGVL